MSARITNDELSGLAKSTYTDGRYTISFAHMVPDNRAPTYDGIFVNDKENNTSETLLFKCRTQKLIQASLGDGLRYHSYKRFEDFKSYIHDHPTHYLQHSTDRSHKFSKVQHFDKKGQNLIISGSQDIPEGTTFFDFVDEKALMLRVENILQNANDENVPDALKKQKEQALAYIAFNKARQFPQV